MPYGQEAGHYRDITALVNTGHPSRIPSAYKYRQGDYSTLVEVIILNTRQWVPGYFPPPDDQTYQQIALPRQQHGLCLGGSQRIHTQNPSSSSDSAPPEPTRDLSCWSPRSHQTSPTMVCKWKLKKKQPKQNQSVERKDSKMTLPLWPTLTCLISLDGSIFFNSTIETQTSLRGHRSDAATVNRLGSKDPHGAHMPIRVSISTLARCHIAESLLAMLTTPLSDKSTSGELPLNPVEPPSLGSYRTLLTSHKKDLTTLTLDLTPLHRNVDSHLSNLTPSLFSTLTDSDQMKIGRSPNKPKIHTSLSFWACLTPTLSQFLRAHPVYSPILTPDPNGLAHSLQPYREDGHKMLSENYPTQFSCHRLALPDTFGPTSQQTQPSRHYLAMSDTLGSTAQQTHELREPLSYGAHLSSHQTTEFNPTVHEQNEKTQGSKTTDILVPQLSPIRCNRTHTTENKKKGKQMATRRSPRLQAKNCAPQSMAKLSERAKSLTAKLLFDHTATDAPIDARTALTILQASGLEITKQVREMVEEAVRQDKQEIREEEMAPTTPLHDHIPPLLMPGADLPL